MNATLQTYVPAGSVNPQPMHVISNDLNFINDSENFTLLSKTVLRAINVSNNIFNMETNGRKNLKGGSEKLKNHKRDIFTAQYYAKQIDSIHDRYNCLGKREIKNWHLEKEIALDSGNLAYARIIDNTVQDNNGITPLMEAIINNSPIPEIRELIGNGASIDIQDKQNNTALMWLIKSFYHAANEAQIESKVIIMENLFHAGANMTIAGPAGFTPMMYTVAVNSVPAFKKSFRNADDFKSVNDAGETALHLALKYDADPEILTVLISLYNFMNVKDKCGYTPFMIASFRARHDIMDTFLKKGGNIDDADTHGRTALMHAVSSDDVKTVNYLLAKGASVLIRDCCDKDALKMAQEQERNHMVNLLLSKIKSESEKVKGVNNDPQPICEDICDYGPHLADSHSLKVYDNTQYEIIDIEHRAILSDVAVSAARRPASFAPVFITSVVQSIYNGIRKLSITRTSF